MGENNNLYMENQIFWYLGIKNISKTFKSELKPKDDIRYKYVFRMMLKSIINI